MAIHPEQMRALDYARRKGTEALFSEIRWKVAATQRDFERALDPLSSAQAKRSPEPGCWSVHEVVDHLVESNRRAVEELASLVRGDSPESGPIPASLQSDDPFAKSWPDLVAGLESVHAAFLDALDGATDQTPLEARAPIVMVVKCRSASGELEPVQWIETFDWKAYAILFRAHTLEHLQQVERIMDTLADQDASS